MNTDYFRRDSRGKLDCLFGDATPAVDGDNGDGRCRLISRKDGLHAQRAHTHEVIVSAYEAEEHDQHGNKQQGDPGPFQEFRDQYR
jgi:hypothetical protein